MLPSLGNILLAIIFLRVGVAGAEFNYTTLPTDFVTVEEGKEAGLRMNLTGITKTLQIETSSSDLQKFTLEQASFQVNPIYETILYPNGSTGQRLRDDGIQTITIMIGGISLGIRQIDFVVRDDMGLLDPRFQIQPFIVKVIRTPSSVGTVFTYILLVWLMISYVTMGVKIEWGVIKKKMKRPFGVVIGAMCQFIVMPGIAALLARVLNLEPTASVALIIVGSCPGGWLSNVFTLLLDCDLVLSLTMTFCSTVIALGMMPLNLFIYATPYARNNSNIRIPFEQIFIQLITLVVPLFIGTFLAHRYPRVAKWFRKLLKPIAVVLVLVGFAAGLWANYFAFESPADIYLSAIILPCVAALLAFFVSKLTCLSNHSSITIAIETGSQNGLLATSVIAFSFPQPEADLMTRVPVLFVTFIFIEGLCMTAIYVVMKRFPGRFELPDDDDRVDHDDLGDKAIKFEPSHENGNTKLDISSRIVGVGSSDFKQSSKPRKKTKQSWMFSKSTQVDLDEIRRSSDNARSNVMSQVRSHSRSVSHVNHAYDAEEHGPISVYNISTATMDDTANQNARQVYI
ncbi:ileal sodium/bile acid cotransporter-like [Lytechinus variegatus]|uniref:ileal sodium/bile acid cotransporter-like n=1 Tax=Lytechinus variegatus TaxID=7654 RepID=UPI001BB1E56A|nr:ileal sodium/bile acid cotransporter-like [Lytechinus variegatus]